MRALKDAGRRLLERNGYYIVDRAVLPYGIDFMHDVQRLTSSPIEVFFDIGAHHGQTTRQALSAFPSANIFAFEPYPKAFQFLKGLESERVRVENSALGAKSGGATLAINTQSRHSLVFADAGTDYTAVNVTTVDAFCREAGISKIDVLKTDTEGYDIDVLHGAIEMLTNHNIGFVYSEFFAFANGDKRGTKLNELADFLQAFGFRLVATYTDFVSDDVTSANALFAP